MIVALAAGSSIAAVFIAAHDAGRPKAAAKASAPSSCQKALLDDWSDGRIDRQYSIACYRAALKSLPTDLKVYSSAPDDIAQALSQRILQSAGKRKAARKLTR